MGRRTVLPDVGGAGRRRASDHGGGLSHEDALSPLQAAFRKHHALQCGFCTPGMLMTAHALLTDEPDASEERIREVLSGNLCRCTGYIPIIEAVLEARAAYSKRA